MKTRSTQTNLMLGVVKLSAWIFCITFECQGKEWLVRKVQIPDVSGGFKLNLALNQIKPGCDKQKLFDISWRSYPIKDLVPQMLARFLLWTIFSFFIPLKNTQKSFSMCYERQLWIGDFIIEKYLNWFTLAKPCCL